MTHVRLPRQPPGDGLTPVTVRLTTEEKDALWQRAEQEGRSVSYVAREALQRYLRPAEPTE